MTTRREFLIATAAGLVAATRRGAIADEQLLYVGTYTDKSTANGVHLVRLNPGTGALTHVSAFDAGANPSFLALHPDGKTLYAVNELEEFNGQKTGTVRAFSIAPDTHALTQLSEELTGGGAPCYVSTDGTGNVLLVANYMGGSVALFPIAADGSIDAALQIVKHVGSGPNHERQEGPHAHCIIPDPSNGFALAADLGVDHVLVYRLDAAHGSLAHVPGGDGELRAGAGPRHLAFHPTLPLLFVSNELESTVSSFHWSAASGGLTLGETRSTLPPGTASNNYPADIHVSADGRSLYVSNRGHNSIAMFSVTAAGGISREQVLSCGGDWPRNFAIDPTGRWLLVANQRSDSIVVFARDAQTGRLTPTTHRLEVSKPVCLRFL